ncbi:MAG: patatin-like phospholipase family protein [Betaproteobacteria bacterium]|nr:patatin-like phospholipase family protein [Betaproteobacteria bacterium]
MSQHSVRIKSESIPSLVRNYEFIALVFQGGGALGSYQAGVFEGLSEAGIEPNWMSGVSIGAINASIIAGNKPEDRVAKLKEFWETVTDHGYASHLAGNDDMRTFHNMTSAFMSMISGIPGFYKPRMMSPWQQVPGQAGATSHYDTSDLKDHLNSLINWDILNSDSHRLSVGAVNVRTGNYKYFDTALERLGPEHIMASGALPPAFPAMKIGSEFYWDGGIVSNTPLQYLLELHKLHKALVFQVDLFNARGDMPKTMPEVMSRQKDIMFSSRTRNATNRYKKTHDLQIKLRDALSRIDPAKWTPEDKVMLEELQDTPQVNVLQLIYHHADYEGDSKDYEFSKWTMREHWAAGLEDARRTLSHPDWLKLPDQAVGMTVHDVHREDGR